MIDLAELREACRWAGILASPTSFGLRLYCVNSHDLIWDGTSEDGCVAFLLRDGIDERVQDLERSATGDPVKDQPKRDAFILGRDFLNSRVSGFSAIGAAECLIAMWKAAKVSLPGEAG